MFDYRDFITRLHIRGLKPDDKQYLFVAMVCAGEDISVAYGLTFDTVEFKRNVPSDNEDEYLASIRHKAEVMLQMQECAQLREVINEAIRAEIQSKATNIKEYKFSSQEIVNMLSSLLADRSAEISEASVRDIVQLIRELVNLGGLAGSDGFESHFIQVHEPFNALCTSCNREMDAYAGLDCRCVHCGQVYRWSEEERRFYPQITKL